MLRFDYLHYRMVPDLNYTGIDAERFAILNQCQPIAELFLPEPLPHTNPLGFEFADTAPTTFQAHIRPIASPKRYLARRAIGTTVDKLPRLAFASTVVLASLALNEYDNIEVGPAISAAVTESGLAEVDLQVGASVAARNGDVDPLQLKMLLDNPDTRVTVDDFERRATTIVQTASERAKRSVGLGVKALASAAVGAAGLLINNRRRNRPPTLHSALSNTTTYIGDEASLQKLPITSRLHFTPFAQGHITGVDSRDQFQVHEVTTSRQTRSVQRGLSLAALAAVTLTMVPKMLDSSPVDSASSSIDGVTNRVIPTGKIRTNIPSFITEPFAKRVSGPIIPAITADLPNITGALDAVDRSLVGYIEEQTEDSGIDTSPDHQVSLKSGVFGPVIEGVSSVIEHIGFDPVNDYVTPHNLAVPLALIAAAGMYGSRKRPERFLVTQRVLDRELGAAKK